MMSTPNKRKNSLVSLNCSSTRKVLEGLGARLFLWGVSVSVHCFVMSSVQRDRCEYGTRATKLSCR
jgi:hypothetical protein